MGAERELKTAIAEWNQAQVHDVLLKRASSGHLTHLLDHIMEECGKTDQIGEESPELHSQGTMLG